MKIAAVQMVSTPDWSTNREAAARLVREATAAGAALVALPEYFCLMGDRDTDKLALAETAGSGPIQDFLAATARECGIWLVGGTLPVRTDVPGQVLNRCCVFTPDGSEAAHYDKVHLFAFDNGRESYDEGRTAAGRPGTGGAGGGRRWRIAARGPFDLLRPALPGAVSRADAPALRPPLRAGRLHLHHRRAHWELLLRARAVENQCYVLAAAQGGTHANGRRTWGHSMVVGPWGEVLAQCTEGEGVVVAEVDAQHIAQVRQQLPALAHRRL